MKRRDLRELLLLAAIWGASFLFMRVGAPEFGAVVLAWLRLAGATLVLLPLLLVRGDSAALRAHWRPILLIGITNSALPFVLFTYALLSISAGLSSIFNSSSPLFAALIGWLWLGERLSAPRVAGLAVGFAGVLGLAAGRAALGTHAEGTNGVLAIAATLLAALSYGFSVNYARRHLDGVAPMAVAAGSQLAGALVLL
ncbi:MAG TPA: DMT family transporter, partial [Ideonella sp.]|nr:DMT family transporter [Ideonella sp.]